MNSIVKLFDLLTPRERWRSLWLFSMMLVMALLDMVGVASIMPFIAVLTNSQLIKSNVFLAAAYQSLDFNNEMNFLLFLGVLVFVLLVLSLTFKALTTYFQLRFALFTEFGLSKRLIEGYLKQPYPWFLNRNSADLSKAILSETGAVIRGCLMPIMTLVAQGAVVACLLMLLVFVDPLLAILVCLVLGTAYGLILISMSGLLSRLGDGRVKANELRFMVASEAFGAIKEIKVGGLEQVYVDRFAKPAESYARLQVLAQVVSQIPRFALEAIAFGGMLLVILYFMMGKGGFASALPVVALYAFAGYRLMPALQLIYHELSYLIFIGPTLDILHADYSNINLSRDVKNNSSILPLSKSIDLESITFSYSNSDAPALKNINLNIPACSTIAFVGVSGSGKTTLVDLILGLLEPQEGVLSVDSQIIGWENRRRWQNGIGYVPQQIYLADGTIAENIAFGVASNDIDQSTLVEAAKLANLHDFIVNELPLGYDTPVGERGIRLSGGQRQRIGISRALYRNPQVLLLDEATSALDNVTEQAVMEAINNLEHKITIIVIAHRLNTVRKCDHIYLLEKGHITAHGTYEHLLRVNEKFQTLAGI